MSLSTGDLASGREGNQTMSKLPCLVPAGVLVGGGVGVHAPPLGALPPDLGRHFLHDVLDPAPGADEAAGADDRGRPPVP